jgi:hypothetical protein
MTEPRPRSFVWLQSNGHFFPQVWYDGPRVGCEGMTPVAERKLEPDEYALTLDQLVTKYPAPVSEKAS